MEKKEKEKGFSSKRLVVQVDQGPTFASVLKRIRSGVDPNTTNVRVLSVISTLVGNLKKKFDRKTDSAAFSARVEKLVAGVCKLKKERVYTST